MPVLQNIDTQLAENVPAEQAQNMLASGTHEVPIYSPDGTFGTAPASEVPKLLAEGYTQPSPEQLGHLMNEAKYSTTAEELKAAGHGILKGALPFGAGTALERAFGRKPEDIRGEEEFSPDIVAGGEFAGLAGSSIIPGLGQSKVLSEAGKAASLLSKSRVAQVALRGAAETALLQSGNEISKMLSEDPHQSLQTAVANVSLAGLLGGAGGAALGSVHPLWEKASGTTAGKFITDAQSRFSDLRRGFSQEELGIGGKMADWLELGGEKIPLKASETSGEKFADWVVKHSTAKVGAEGMGGAIGAMLGKATGLPWAGTAGAFLGKAHIGPFIESVLPAILKPLMEGEASASALKAAADYGLAVIKGENLTGKAVASLFKAGAQELATLPSERDIAHVENWLKVAQVDPETLLNSQQHDMGHYLPGHNEAAGETVARALGVLHQAKPTMPPSMPLDSKMQPNPVAQAHYEQTRQIVIQPLSILGRIKDGTITPSAVTTLKTAYPAYYTNLSQKITNQIIDLTHKGEPIPYRLRLGLSAFLGQPLDSSIAPASIMANQSQPQGTPQAPTEPGRASKGTKNSFKQLPSMYATPQQANEQNKLLK